MTAAELIQELKIAMTGSPRLDQLIDDYLDQPAWGAGYRAALSYTTDMTAATRMLVERQGFLWSVHNEPKVYVKAAIWPNDQLWQDGDYEAEGATPELALCIALISAIAQRSPTL